MPVFARHGFRRAGSYVYRLRPVDRYAVSRTFVAPDGATLGVVHAVPSLRTHDVSVHIGLTTAFDDGTHVAAHAGPRRAVSLEPADAMANVARLFAHQVALGRMVPCDRGRHLRFTFRGASIAIWLGLPPVQRLLGRRDLRRAQALAADAARTGSPRRA